MFNAAAPRSPVRSLATIRPGESLVVAEILFDSNLQRCAAVGLAPGDHVRAVLSCADGVVLETGAGAPVVLTLDVARFVRVESAAVAPA